VSQNAFFDWDSSTRTESTDSSEISKEQGVVAFVICSFHWSFLFVVVAVVAWNMQSSSSRVKAILEEFDLEGWFACSTLARAHLLKLPRRMAAYLLLILFEKLNNCLFVCFLNF
jgi:hypothetical protein